MSNKMLEKAVNEESAKRLVAHFNNLILSRDYKGARDFYNAQSEAVRRKIQYDDQRWHDALKMSKL